MHSQPITSYDTLPQKAQSMYAGLMLLHLWAKQQTLLLSWPTVNQGQQLTNQPAHASIINRWRTYVGQRMKSAMELVAALYRNLCFDSCMPLWGNQTKAAGNGNVMKACTLVTLPVGVGKCVRHAYCESTNTLKRMAKLPTWRSLNPNRPHMPGLWDERTFIAVLSSHVDTVGASVAPHRLNVVQSTSISHHGCTEAGPL